MELTPPIKGVAKGMSAGRQPQLTSGYMNNVRPTDVLEKRIRIGQRPGLEKWGAGTQIGDGENPVVAICSVSAVV